MTLLEYVNQVDPVPFPNVFLELGEYTVGGSYTNEEQDVCTLITINHYPQYNYILINNFGRLYSADSYGNKKKASVFLINHPVAPSKES